MPFLGALLLGSAVRAQDLAALAKELAELRSEVERLSGTLAEEKGDLQDELRTFARQKAELALENDREAIRLQKLRLTIAEKRKVVEQRNAESTVLLPAFNAGWPKTWITG